MNGAATAPHQCQHPLEKLEYLQVQLEQGPGGFFFVCLFLPEALQGHH